MFRVASSKRFLRLVRGISGMRRLMSDFIKTVHPDLTPEFPDTARRINQASLSELNALIDKLEVTDRLSMEEGPEVGRELPFFRAYVTRAGRILPGRVSPLRLPVPALSVSASEEDREFAAVRLIRDAELVLANTSSGFADHPEVPPLFTQRGAARSGFDRLWWQQTQEEMLRMSLEGPSDEELRKQAILEVFAKKYEYRLLRRYTKIKNSSRRRKKLAAVNAKVETMLKNRFGTEFLSRTRDDEELENEDDPDEGRAAARLARTGFHPNLVFVSPTLHEEQRREAVRR
eukprot:2124588-Amphidinium_carterae.1